MCMVCSDIYRFVAHGLLRRSLNVKASHECSGGVHILLVFVVCLRALVVVHALVCRSGVGLLLVLAEAELHTVLEAMEECVAVVVLKILVVVCVVCRSAEQFKLPQGASQDIFLVVEFVLIQGSGSGGVYDSVNEDRCARYFISRPLKNR